ncbi:MAG TPA: NPCBM/NEW2 domain-containing protein [Opitutaceae bacterium]|nr:NPCBM/NEW2 domain-containing protein [Opitutaceae bacterium]
MNATSIRRTGWLLALIVLTFSPCGAAVIRLTTLDLGQLHFAGWKRPSIVTPGSGKSLTIGDRPFTDALAIEGTSSLWLELDGRTRQFTGWVGTDAAAAVPGVSVVFTIVGDDRVLWRSPLLHRGDPAVPVDVGLEGVHTLLLKIDRQDDNVRGGAAAWADAHFEFSGAAPRTVAVPPEPFTILTPPPPPAPRLNGPTVYGCRPGHPFLYRIPTTGRRPIRFIAANLPSTLRLDPATGIITGVAPAWGTYEVALTARNRSGTATRTFRIVSGDTIALTPPMGWNDWYADYRRVTDRTIRAAADAMLASGMADVGYAYVNIDDCWARVPAAGGRTRDPRRIGPGRDAGGNLLPNAYFPDMAALTAYLHSRGLKAGIYSSPGPVTCAGYAGSYQHEEQDARQFAAWGFDFLKYDWCSYERVTRGVDTLDALQRPYRVMGDALRHLPRDLVFNLCQYGRGSVWKWGASVGANCWRTSRDLGGELNRFLDVALANSRHAAWSGPGAWNDPDYLQIGFVGDAHGGGLPRPCPLTPTEQYAFMSAWSLMAAPLIYSGDMGHLDAFTLNVLCNPEVIAIDQDPLGRSAQPVILTADTFLLVKPLADGSVAVGLCNRGDVSTVVHARWSDVRVDGPQRVRDVWPERDLGSFTGEFSATVPRHGVRLLRLTPLARN